MFVPRRTHRGIPRGPSCVTRDHTRPHVLPRLAAREVAACWKPIFPRRYPGAPSRGTGLCTSHSRRILCFPTYWRAVRLHIDFKDVQKRFQAVLQGHCEAAAGHAGGTVGVPSGGPRPLLGAWPQDRVAGSLSRSRSRGQLQGLRNPQQGRDPRWPQIPWAEAPL